MFLSCSVSVRRNTLNSLKLHVMTVLWYFSTRQSGRMLKFYMSENVKYLVLKRAKNNTKYIWNSLELPKMTVQSQFSACYPNRQHKPRLAVSLAKVRARLTFSEVDVFSESLRWSAVSFELAQTVFIACAHWNTSVHAGVWDSMW